MTKHFDWVIVGAGFSGAVLAERISNVQNKSVLIIEQRNHIGGNAFDFVDTNGILVHKYGPHLFHTNSEKVWQYISKFSEWDEYKHRVNAKFENFEIPLPININSLEILIGNSTDLFLNEVELEFGHVSEISIIKLIASKNSLVQSVGQLIFEKIFTEYSEKQWGISVNKVSPSTLSRIPVRLSRNDDHFSDSFQFLPKYGYNELFLNLLNNKNITIELNTEFNPKNHSGKIGTIFTGAIDQLNSYSNGYLPYRSLRFNHQQLTNKNFQKVAQVNYTDSTPFTRIIDYGKLYHYKDSKTTIVYEYPMAHDHKTTIPFYPIDSDENKKLHKDYIEITNKKFPMMLMTGRLADYRYFNMDQVIAKSLTLFETLVK